MLTALATQDPAAAIGGLQQALVLAPAEVGRVPLRPLARERGAAVHAILAIDGGTRLAEGDRVLLAWDAGGEAYVIGVIARRDAAPSLIARGGARARLIDENGGEAIQVLDAHDRLVFEYRPDEGEGTISVPQGNLALRAPAGDVLLEAGGRVRCRAGTEVDLRAGSQINAEVGTAGSVDRTRFSLSSRSAKLATQAFELSARRGLLRIAEASYFGVVFDGTVERARLAAGKIETLAERVVERARDVYRQVHGLYQLKAGRVRTLVEDSYYTKAHQAYLLAEKDVRIDGEQIRLG